MSFLGLLNRTISVVPMTVSGTDGFGNDVRTAGTAIPGIRARRQQLDATEDVVDRDQQAQTFRYVLPAGTVINGRDRIVDGTEMLEVLGPPDRVASYSLEHHLELRARLIEG